MPETMTLEQVENMIKANQAETQRQIDAKLAEVPDAVKAAIELKAKQDKIPGRVPLEEKAATIQSDSAAYDAVMAGALSGGGKAAQKLAILRQTARYAPAVEAYKDVEPYHTLGEWMVDAARTFPGTKFYTGPNARIKAPLAESQLDTGGALIPPQFRPELQALEIEGDQFTQLATMLPMSSLRLLVPIITDTTHAGGLVFGGIATYWASEAGLLTESEPTFDQLQLEAHKLTAYTVASNEVLADGAISLEALIRQRFPQAMTWKKNTKFWNGLGAGEPEGILNCAAVYSQAKETGQTANTIVYDNILNMYSHMLPTSINKAVWFIHPNVMPQLGKLAINVGTGGGPVFIQFGGAQDPFPLRLLGRPVYVSEHMAGLGTVGDIAFVDLSYYIIGDRQELSMDASPHVKFTTDQTVWRFIERLDGRPWIRSTLTLEHGSHQVSPFVTLATRS